MNRVPLRFAAALNRRVLPETTDPGLEFRYMDISAVDSTGRVALPDELMTFAGAPSRARRVAPAGATAISTVRTYLRAIARVPDSAVPLVLSTGFAVAEATTGYDPRFLYYACRSNGFVDEVVARSVGVSYPAINPSDLAAIPIPSPTIDAQRRIADFLDDQVARIGNIIAARRQQLRRVIAARESAVFDSITGVTSEDRRPSGLSWAETLPSDWGSTRLTHVARMGTGHTPSRSVAEYWIDCTIPWLTTSDVHRFRRDEIDQIADTELHISKRGLANSAAVLHPTGTVALSRTASAGFSIVMGNGMATSQDYATRTCGTKINNLYLLWCLRTMRRNVMGRLATGSTHKTIYFPDLMSIRVPLPPVADQLLAVTAIGEVVDAERQRSAAITWSIELFLELKRSLITAAVTGEFDVSSADGSRVRV